MFNTIHTSAANKGIVTDLTRRLNLGPENTIARIALAYSLSKGRILQLNEIQDSKGKEYSQKVLFGNNSHIYIALISQHYGIYKTDKDIPRYIKMHIDDGLQMINDELEKNPNLTGFDFLLSKIESGLLYFK